MGCGKKAAKDLSVKYQQAKQKITSNVHNFEKKIRMHNYKFIDAL